MTGKINCKQNKLVTESYPECRPMVSVVHARRATSTPVSDESSVKLSDYLGQRSPYQHQDTTQTACQ